LICLGRAQVHDPDEVRDELNTSSAQVYALVRSRDLPAGKLGGRCQGRVERSLFEAWVS
jgi:hypothetical protein